MVQVLSSIMINRSVEEVFFFVSHFENDVKWWAHVSESIIISDVKEGIGTTYQQVARFMGKNFESILRITEYDPPHQVILQSIKSVILFKAVFTFEPMNSSTFFTMKANVSGTSFYKLVQPIFNFLMQRATNQNFVKLKELLESK